jgi:hypothetical protein
MITTKIHGINIIPTGNKHVLSSSQNERDVVIISKIYALCFYGHISIFHSQLV